MRALLVISISFFAIAALSAFQVQPQKPKALFVIIQDDKRGFIDETGRVVIAPQFHGANNFSEGLAVVAVSSPSYKEGFVDTSGQIVIEPGFDAASDFSEGLAAVGFDTERTKRGCSDCDPNQHWGYIDKSGRSVIEPQFHRAGNFSEGLAAVERDDGKWIYVNRSGRVAIKTQFDFASKFAEGLAGVTVGKRTGYIDHRGRMLIKPRFTSFSNFSESLARVRIGGKTISRFGISSGKLGGTWAYINRLGTIVIKLQGADSAEDFSEGLASFEVKKNDGYLYCGYIDKTGKTVIPPQFGDCERFSEGLAAILLEGKWYYINKTGKVVISAPFFLVEDFHNGLAWVTEGKGGTDVGSEKYGYIDRTGRTVWSPSR